MSNQVKLEFMLNREHFTWWHFFLAQCVSYRDCESEKVQKKILPLISDQSFFSVYLLNFGENLIFVGSVRRVRFLYKIKIFILFCKTVLISYYLVTSVFTNSNSVLLIFELLFVTRLHKGCTGYTRLHTCCIKVAHEMCLLVAINSAAPIT